MSLDTVELVMTVEETFDITIPDRDAEKILTVGDLFRYLLDRVPLSDGHGCLSSATFYRLRRVLMDEFGVSRARVRPGALVGDLVPHDDRPARWKALERALGSKLPGLVRPSSVQTRLLRLFWAWYLPSTLLFILAVGQVAPAWAVALGVGLSLAGAVLLVAGFLSTLPPAVELAPNCQTVRGLVEALVGESLPPKHPEGRGWSEGTVWEAVRAIVVAQSGVSPDRVTAEASFVYDLGMD